MSRNAFSGKYTTQKIVVNLLRVTFSVLNLTILTVGWLAGLAGLAGCSSEGTSSVSGPALSLLNASYDPTRELYRELNSEFSREWSAQQPGSIEIRQSHGASGSQARAVIDGLEADVVSLALWTDTDALRKKGLISEGWEDRLPHRSLPYHSTIVFVVRRGNPRKSATGPIWSSPA